MRRFLNISSDKMYGKKCYSKSNYIWIKRVRIDARRLVTWTYPSIDSITLLSWKRLFFTAMITSVYHVVHPMNCNLISVDWALYYDRFFGRCAGHIHTAITRINCNVYNYILLRVLVIFTRFNAFMQSIWRRSEMWINFLDQTVRFFHSHLVPLRHGMLVCVNACMLVCNSAFLLLAKYHLRLIHIFEDRM